MKYIAIGNCNKYNIYILISLLCHLFKTSITGFSSSNKEKSTRIFSFRPKIKDHILLDNFIRLTAIFFGGIILFFFEKANESKRKDKITIKDYEIMQINLLDKKNESTNLNIFIIGVLFSLYIILKEFLDLTKIHLGFWTFEIMYICIISHIIFKIKIYRHRKIAIGIMLVLGIVDFVGFFYPMTKEEEINELTNKNVFEIVIIKYGGYLIPILFLAYELKNIQRDYCWLKAKYLMDVRACQLSRVFLAIGSIGIILVTIFFSIFTYVPCKTFNNIDKIGNKYFYNNTGEPLKLYLEYCSLKDYDEKNKILYLIYDSIKLISKEYSSKDKDNMLEIFLVIPLLFIIYLVNEISRLMLVRYTDPNNILVYKNFYYFVKRIIEIIINGGDEQNITYIQFFILELEELISVVSNLVYIELLELKFCRLDYELKKNIDKRGNEDFLEIFDLADDTTVNSDIELIQPDSLEDKSSHKS